MCLDIYAPIDTKLDKKLRWIICLVCSIFSLLMNMRMSTKDDDEDEEMWKSRSKCGKLFNLCGKVELSTFNSVKKKKEPKKLKDINYSEEEISYDSY